MSDWKDRAIAAIGLTIMAIVLALACAADAAPIYIALKLWGGRP